MSEHVPSSDSPEAPPAALLVQLSFGQTVSQLLYVAAKLGIADLLQTGELPIGDLAQRTDANARALYRVLRALASLGVFVETQPECFAMTELAAPLATDHPASLRYWVIMTGERWQRRAWDEILYSVQTGRPGFQHAFGMGTFEYFAQHPQDSAVFYQAMKNLTAGQAEALVAAINLAGMERIVDVGGGSGLLLASLLKANPQAHGTLYDLPHVMAEARAVMEAEGVAERCEFVPGDFFVEVPAGGDAYILKYILHDWADAEAAQLLRNCRRAMLPHSRLLIAETVIPPGNARHIGKLADILMLIMEGGHERTAAEFEALLHASGFKLAGIRQTQSALSIIEAVPVL